MAKSGSERVRAYRERNRQRVEDAKVGQSCHVCGEDSPAVLIFVGKGWQSIPITQLINRNANWTAILNEMKGATVVCLNDQAKALHDQALERVADGR